MDSRFRGNDKLGTWSIDRSRMVWLRCEIPSLALGAAVGQKKGGHGVTMGRHGGLPLHVDWYGGGRAMAKIRLTMESFGYAQDRPKLEASATLDAKSGRGLAGGGGQGDAEDAASGGGG